MKSLMCATLLLALVSLRAQAKDYSVVAANKRFNISVSQVRDDFIMKNGSATLHVGSLTHSFIALKGMDKATQPYLVSLWHKGAHGQSVYVHDLASGKELWHINSSWPVDWKISGGELTVVYTKDSDENHKFPQYRVKWSGPGTEKIEQITE